MKKLGHERGSFLVELMIGLTLSALSVLAVLTVYANFEGQKRTTTQMGHAVSNAAMSIFPIQHFGKQAGYGMNNSLLLGCKVNAYSEKGGGEFNFVLAPVVINFSGDNAVSDSVEFLIGNSDSYFAPMKITQSMPSPSAVYKVDNRFGLREGDLLIAAEAGKDCTLSQVSNLPGTPGKTDNVIHNSGNYTDPETGKQEPTNFNKPGGLGVSYNVGAEIYNLGAAPQHLIYSVVNNQLIQNNNFSNENDVSTIGDNVVLLKASYGLDMDNDGDVEQWSVAAQANLRPIKAIRVALLVRSPLREKAEGGACSTTASSSFNWFDGTMDISGLADWACYRYRLVQTTIPLRNMLWQN